jgi:hypothetical protein
MELPPLILKLEAFTLFSSITSLNINPKKFRISKRKTKDTALNFFSILKLMILPPALYTLLNYFLMYFNILDYISLIKL